MNRFEQHEIVYLPGNGFRQCYGRILEVLPDGVTYRVELPADRRSVLEADTVTRSEFELEKTERTTL